MSEVVGIAKWRSSISRERTPVGANEAFIAMVGKAWDEIQSVFIASSPENDMSRRLKWWIQDEHHDINRPWSISSQAEEVALDDNGNIVVTGKPDLWLNVGSAQILYECKRLNILAKNGSLSRNQKQYTDKNGIGRFTREKYSSRTRICGMIGFVMNGDLADAQRSVVASINQCSSPDAVINPKKPFPCMNSYRLKTKHRADTGKLLHIHHLLLPVGNSA